MGALGKGREIGQVSDYMGNDLPGVLVKCLILGACDFKLYCEQPIVQEQFKVGRSADSSPVESEATYGY